MNSAVGTRKNIQITQQFENGGLRVEILEYQKLLGISNTATAQRVFFMEQQNIKVRQIALYLNNEKVTVEKDHEMLNVTATARNIEYSKSLAENYNRIMDGLKQLPADHIVRKILDTLQDDKIAVVSALLDAISEKKKEAIIKLLIGEFHESLCAFLTKLLNDNKIELAIKKISFD